MIWVTDVKGSLLYIPPEWETVTGQSVNETYGHCWIDKDFSDDPVSVHGSFEQIQRTKHPYVMEFRPSTISVRAWVRSVGTPADLPDAREFAGYLGIVEPLEDPVRSSVTCAHVGHADESVDRIESPRATPIEDLADHLILAHHSATKVGDELLLNIINIALHEVGRKLAIEQVLESKSG